MDSVLTSDILFPGASFRQLSDNLKFFLHLLQPVVVLDIEGTTTPISFVADILFPYAKKNAGSHLLATFDSIETQEDIKLLRKQVKIRHLSIAISPYISLISIDNHGLHSFTH